MYVLKFESDIYNLFLLQSHTCKGLMFCFWKPLVLFSIQIFWAQKRSSSFIPSWYSTLKQLPFVSFFFCFRHIIFYQQCKFRLICLFYCFQFSQSVKDYKWMPLLPVFSRANGHLMTSLHSILAVHVCTNRRGCSES